MLRLWVQQPARAPPPQRRTVPIDGALELRGRVKEIRGRKVIVETTVFAQRIATARGEVVAVQMPESFGAK